ncbi:MAG: LysM peptidoglycan-binding domain-containing protein [Acidobacteriota bacterium]|nr:LysM peptidoglycan-binding domain-containing protein [Acidobacteriota bacterium]
MTNASRLFGRVLPVAAGALFAALSGCATDPHARVALPPAPEEPGSVQTARTQSTELFFSGKALALAGESDCARGAFRDALETFRAAARPGNPADLAFATELFDSIALYRPAIEAGSRVAEAERPPAEDPRDSLVATAPLPSADEIERAKKEVAAAPAGSGFDIPIVVNDAVLRAVAFYQFRTPMAFAAALKRSGRYMSLMRGILKEEGVPEDLVYVAMIESAFKYQAHSRAAAHGFWQFIPGTGKRYGLKRTASYDERSDPVKSTRAAAAYFRDLYEMFGDWHLAMAAYDAGEGKILRSLQRTGARDFWDLSAGSTLRRETRDYVPFVLATALIARDPARFGFDVVPDSPLSWETVTVKKSTDLSRVAELTGNTLPDLQLLNSELRTRSTPHGVPSYELRVPAGAAALLAPRLASLPSAPAVTEKRIVVKKDESLQKIARRAGVSVAELCDWNDLPRTAKPKKGTVLVVPTKRQAAPHDALVSASSSPKGEIRGVPTPAAAVTRASDVGPFTSVPATAVPSRTAPAALVRVPLPSRISIPDEGFVDTPPGHAGAQAPQVVRHTVRAGDTLYAISSRYGVSVDEIRRQNHIRSPQALRTGQTLVLSLATVN